MESVMCIVGIYSVGIISGFYVAILAIGLMVLVGNIQVLDVAVRMYKKARKARIV